MMTAYGRRLGPRTGHARIVFVIIVRQERGPTCALNPIESFIRPGIEPGWDLGRRDPRPGFRSCDG